MDIILVCIVFIPTVATFLLRNDGAMIFAAVCIGSVLATYVAADASSVIAGVGQTGVLTTMQWTQLGLLAVPLMLALVLTRKKAKGVTLILSTITAAAASSFLVILATPYLSSSMQATVHKTGVWHELNNLETPIILVGVFLFFLHLFLSRWKPDDGKKKHKS